MRRSGGNRAFSTVYVQYPVTTASAMLRSSKSMNAKTFHFWRTVPPWRMGKKLQTSGFKNVHDVAISASFSADHEY